MEQVLFAVVSLMIFQSPMAESLEIANAPKLFVQLWIEENADVNSVRGDVRIYQYDDVFQTVATGSGRFEYINPQRGFLFTYPSPGSDDEKIQQVRGKSYDVKAYPAGRWVVKPDEVLLINVDRKQYQKYAPCPLQIDGHFPFLPGSPSSIMFNQFSYELTEKTATHLQVRANSLSPELRSQYQSVDLYFQKSPKELLAMRINAPDSNHSTTYIFHNIELNPSPTDTPTFNLKEFKQILYWDRTDLDPISMSIRNSMNNSSAKLFTRVLIDFSGTLVH